MGHGFCNRLESTLTFGFFGKLSTTQNTVETWLCRGCLLGTEWCICFLKKKDQMVCDSTQVGALWGAEAESSGGMELKSSVSVHSSR